jgi:hypothetical protein
VTAAERCLPTTVAIPIPVPASALKAAATAPAGTTAATGARFLWFRLVDRQRPPLHLVPVETLDRSFGFVCVRHLNEAKPARTASKFVHNHVG